jgi:ribonuclease Z
MGSMEVILLGTGGPRPDPDRQGPSLVVRIGGDNVVFDAGRGVATQLVRAGVPITGVGHVFLNHHHFDHTGGLADLIFAAWNKARNETIEVFGPEGTSKMLSHLFDAYSRDIEYRLRETKLTAERLVDIREMVEANDSEPGLIHDAGDWKVHAEYMTHGYGLGMTLEDWPCMGYRVEAEGKAVAISGDAVASPGLQRLAREANLLVQCCYLAGVEITNPDLELISEHVLASSTMVGKIAREARVGKLVLTHIREKPVEMLRSVAEDVRRDFGGELVIGEDLLEIAV